MNYQEFVSYFPGGKQSGAEYKVAPALKLASPAATKETKSAFPSAFEVSSVWTKATPITDDVFVRSWLQHQRGIDPAIVGELDLLRVMNNRGIYPWCKHFGGQNHRAIFPAYNANGELVTLRARAIDPSEKSNTKELAAKGQGGTKGTLFANKAALLFLGGESVDDLWIMEGSMDFLTAAMLAPEKAIIGVHSGSACPALFAAIRNRTKRVILATHHDQAGNKYALQFIGALRDKELRRWKGIEGEPKKDFNDAHKELGAEALLLSMNEAPVCTEKDPPSLLSRSRISSPMWLTKPRRPSPQTPKCTSGAGAWLLSRVSSEDQNLDRQLEQLQAVEVNRTWAKAAAMSRFWLARQSGSV